MDYKIVALVIILIICVIYIWDITQKIESKKNDVAKEVDAITKRGKNAIESTRKLLEESSDDKSVEWKRIKEELDDSILEHKTKYDKLVTQKISLETSAETQSATLGGLNTNIEVLDKKLNDLELEYNNKSTTLSQLKDRFKAIEKTLTNSKNVLTEDVATLTAGIAELDRALAITDTGIKSNTKLKASLIRKKDTMKKKLTTRNELLSTSNDDLVVQNKGLKNEIVFQMAEIKRLNTEIVDTTAQIVKYKAKIKELNLKIDKTNYKIADREHDIDTLQRTIKDMRSVIDGVTCDGKRVGTIYNVDNITDCGTACTHSESCTYATYKEGRCDLYDVLYGCKNSRGTKSIFVNTDTDIINKSEPAKYASQDVHDIFSDKQKYTIPLEGGSIREWRDFKPNYKFEDTLANPIVNEKICAELALKHGQTAYTYIPADPYKNIEKSECRTIYTPNLKRAPVGTAIPGAITRNLTTIYPYDVISTPPCLALSVRQIRSDYYGSCFKLRRDSDSKGTSMITVGFTRIGNLDIHRIRSWSMGDKVYVHTWFSQSKMNHMIQSNIKLQPVLDVSGIPKVVYSGSEHLYNSDFIASKDTSNPNGYTIAGVMKSQKSSKPQHICKWGFKDIGNVRVSLLVGKVNVAEKDKYKQSIVGGDNLVVSSSPSGIPNKNANKLQNNYWYTGDNVAGMNRFIVSRRKDNSYIQINSNRSAIKGIIKNKVADGVLFGKNTYSTPTYHKYIEDAKFDLGGFNGEVSEFIVINNGSGFNNTDNMLLNKSWDRYYEFKYMTSISGTEATCSPNCPTRQITKDDTGVDEETCRQSCLDNKYCGLAAYSDEFGCTQYDTSLDPQSIKLVKDNTYTTYYKNSYENPKSVTYSNTPW